MIKITIVILLFISVPVVIYSAVGTSGGTTVTGAAPVADLNTMAAEIQALPDILGPGMSRAVHLANLGGYGIGQSYLGTFPHFYIGVSVTGGLANLKYFDPDYVKPQGMIPAGSPNPSIFAGIGFGKGLDLLIKAFAFSSGFLPDGLIAGLLPVSYAQLDKFNVYSAGAKLRYNLVSKIKIFPGLLELDGITISLGADFMYGEINVSGAFDYPLSGASFTPDYNLQVSWFMVSVTAQAVLYIDLFWIFDLYFGIGASVNFGSFDVNLQGGGMVGAPVNQTITVSSVNKYYTPVFVPVFVIGLEIDLWVVGIVFESMVNLLNREDINLQLSLRYKY
ncbi:MAG: hypothetical protein PF450_10225 [Bacteroidales bacterium]|nr:hypothetical protein [Bacteroidales bacterium]